MSMSSHQRAHHTPFADLPDELVVHIVSYFASDLEPPERIAKLHQLCLLNRQFSRAARDFLYEKLHVPTDDVSTSLLLRTLRSNPELRLAVKEVEFPSSDMESIQDYDPAELSDIASSLGFLSPHLFASQCIKEHYVGPREAMLALLLCLTPRVSTIVKVTELDLANGAPPLTSLWIKPLLLVTQDEVIGATHMFSCLRNLHMHLTTAPLSYVSSILKLPSLRGLEYDAIRHRYFSPVDILPARKWGCSEASSNVQHLRFTGKIWSTIQDASETIVSCKDLKSFTISPARYRQFSAIKLALLRHSSSLESLQVNDLLRAQFSHRSSTDILGGFHEFRALRVLKCPLYFLRGSENFMSITHLDLSIILPVGLELLVITICGSHHDEAWHCDLREFLHTLRETLPTSLPCLRHIRVLIRCWDHSATPLDFIAIREWFAEVNVQFDWVLIFWDAEVTRDMQLMGTHDGILLPL